MSYGEFFAVGRARVYEIFLVPPDILRQASTAEKYADAYNIIASRPFGRFIDEAKQGFGMDEFLNNTAVSFRDIAAETELFDLEQDKFAGHLKIRDKYGILDEIVSAADPFEFYRRIYDRRIRLAGEIRGEEVLLMVWIAIWWQARLVRMILSSRKAGAVIGDIDDAG